MQEPSSFLETSKKLIDGGEALRGWGAGCGGSMVELTTSRRVISTFVGKGGVGRGERGVGSLPF